MFLTIKILLLSILIFISSILAKKNNYTIIITSGETHAMLRACDCPDMPGGGFPKRASVIDSIRNSNEILLLDAGGFSGGGIYDSYTEGRARDSLRTIAAVKAMAHIGYDAVAVGDEELQYGGEWLVKLAGKSGLPLVSANCRYQSGKYLTEQYRIVKKGDVKFGITGVTTQERFFSFDRTVVVDDPIEAVKRIWKKLRRKSDVQIILSHLGEEETVRLAEEFPRCGLLVNGHRKMSVAPAIQHEKQVVMQFGFQGKTLSSVLFDNSKNRFLVNMADWIMIDEKRNPDSGVQNIVSKIDTINSVKEKTVLDLYIMSQCPYGIPALKGMLELYEKISSAELNISFIGDVNDDGSLHSMHGIEEVEEEKVWLAVKELYPDLWYEFLYLCSGGNSGFLTAISDLRLDTIKIYKWIEEYGTAELKCHYTRSNRLNINASPSLYVNNQAYMEEISFWRLAKDFCETYAESVPSEICDSLPECFTDRECKRKWKIGVCVSDSAKRVYGRCIFKDAVSFDFIVVVPDNPLVSTEEQVINTTEDLFPGAGIQILKQFSEKGDKIIRDFKPEYLPLYLFDQKVRNAVNFAEVEEGLTEMGGWLTFKDGVIRKSYFYKRKKYKDSLVIFIDPLFKNITGVLKTAEEFFPGPDNFSIIPLIYESHITDTSFPEEELRNSEAARWLVIKKYFGFKKFRKYLKIYSQKKKADDWISLLKQSGIDVDKCKEMVKQDSLLLEKSLTEIRRHGIKESVELLFENREVIPINNQFHLKEIFGIIKEKIEVEH